MNIVNEVAEENHPNVRSSQLTGGAAYSEVLRDAIIAEQKISLVLSITFVAILISAFFWNETKTSRENINFGIRFSRLNKSIK